ncbi:MAG: tRNA pseudouridine(13) synthase TruD [Candidatus Micrarchaeaceae archaeon]|jgi:tRNA pseudouridine13 synthase|nr:tRNA pseudouridine(13) synthase TruD [Candidatus Micrarchaeota archaeon]HII10210.1 tRNA pseudouridine(13) synthase TruD [Candidatus Micrarchaeota archaeon]
MLRLSKGERAQGRIKGAAEDFIVEEITSNGIILERDKVYTAADLKLEEKTEGKFSTFVMQKTNWNTSQALKTIAKRFRRGVKSTAFAGTKDRTAISTQLCSVFGVKPEELQNIHIKDISINGAWIGTEKVKMGELLGNRFIAAVRDLSSLGEIDSIVAELNGVFPNYYGEQRFGYRKTNFDIGLSMLKGDFKAAALNFLTETQNETMDDARIARQRLADELDFRAALDYFPKYLKYERSMIEYLSKYPTNYANAIRKLPRSISLMFIHAVEAQIFNWELDERIKSGSVVPSASDFACYENAYGFPDISVIERFGESENRRAFLIGNIIGQDTQNITDFEKGKLEELGITTDSFKVQGLNELHSTGTSRALFAPFKDFDWVHDKENNLIRISFSLPAGSYATIFLDELVAQNAE